MRLPPDRSRAGHRPQWPDRYCCRRWTATATVWTDRRCLRQVQYGTEANLVARQSLYAHQHPRIDLPVAALDLATLCGDETVVGVRVDTGCLVCV